VERQSRLNEEISSFQKQKEAVDSLIVQLEKDKKAFAAAKKFKEAGRCQTELKESQAKLENLES